MDKGGATGVAFLDLKKAFDTVDHEILPYKLTKYGVDGDYVEWFLFIPNWPNSGYKGTWKTI